MKPMRKLLTRAEAERAAALLGVDLDTATADDVKAAFRAIVRSAHPDHSGTTNVDAARDIVQAQSARVTLEKWLTTQPNAKCVVCKGKGHVPRGLGSAPCPRCQPWG